MRHNYYIKQIIIIIVTLIIYCQIQIWLHMAVSWIDKNKIDFGSWIIYLLPSVSGLANVICGMLCGIIFCEKLKLDINKRGTILLTIILLIPSLGQFIGMSHIYMEYLHVYFFSPVFYNLPPYFQVLLGAWFVFWLKAMIDKRRKRKIEENGDEEKIVHNSSCL